MGASPDGILFYGIQVGEEGWNPWIPDYDSYEYEKLDASGELQYLEEKYEDWDGDLAEYVALKEGFKDPWDLVPEEANRYGEFEKWEAENPDWQRLYDSWRQTINDLENSIPVKIVYGGDAFSGYTPAYLALKGTHVYAYGYGVEEVSLEDLLASADDESVRDAIEFCDRYDLGDFREAKWLLTSSYG